ncbi:hypothetical protein AKJ46_00220 [candidate division MSBL1 archaeon SCGC-AAA833K04]|uniref:Uncharacterized protein n=1 Tax=candidate division MSBL1 archaeon SCGC-AAA833K04 TaxID=1698258 RepID=A0A133VST6_9EURY|nr:hypothetical protein AKJ46_00220 [candidate division MSBL1 archaeon SCGC-AAA833K04]
MYLKKESAEAMGEEFRKKPKIAFEDVIEPLEVSKGSDLCTIFDSWWYSTELVESVKDLGHEGIRRLKSNKKLVIDGEKIKVRDSEETSDYEEVSITSGGMRKSI